MWVWTRSIELGVEGAKLVLHRELVGLLTLCCCGWRGLGLVVIYSSVNDSGAILKEVLLFMLVLVDKD